MAEVARGLEVSPNVLHRWQREFRKAPGNAFPGQGRQRWSEGKIAKLERKVGQHRGPHGQVFVRGVEHRGPHGQVFVRGVEHRGPHGQVFVRGVEVGSKLRAHSRLSSVRMSRSRLFLGGMRSRRACLRFTGCG